MSHYDVSYRNEAEGTSISSELQQIMSGSWAARCSSKGQNLVLGSRKNHLEMKIQSALLCCSIKEILAEHSTNISDISLNELHFMAYHTGPV